jgi:ADP-ribosylglycohydrolase
MIVSWVNPVQLVDNELRQLEEEGRDVSEAKQRWLASESLSPERRREEAEAILTALDPLVARTLYDESEPSNLDAILACAGASAAIEHPRGSAVADRILGGWQGRAAGCLLGKPVEKTPRAGIRALLESNDTWPLKAYITARGIPEELRRTYPWNKHYGLESLRENIVCMPEDDDINYPMLNLHLLETKGMDFTTEQVAGGWLDMLPIMTTFTAERVAYLNAAAGFDAPATAIRRNPYREWIGAQIRGDVFGWVSPGDPRHAAALAFRDARLSHVRNGIYGEMFVAGAVAAACVVDSPLKAIEAGLSCIPATSRLSEAVRFALMLPGQAKEWEAALDLLYHRYGTYHWVHAVNNAALVTAAIVYGGGDFERSICNVVMGGWDTDSNGATVGSILGTCLGAARLPGSWIDPLQNRIRSSMRGYDNSAIDDLARRTHALALTTITDKR